MAITASVSAPAGDAPVRFPNTRAQKQPELKKQAERSEEGPSSSAIQARARAERRLLRNASRGGAAARSL